MDITRICAMQRAYFEKGETKNVGFRIAQLKKLQVAIRAQEKLLLDALPNAIAPRTDDHTAAHARFFGHIGFLDDLLIPGGEILFAGDRERVLDSHDVPLCF